MHQPPDTPYVLARDSRSETLPSVQRYLVMRRGDGSLAGHIEQVGEQWEVENKHLRQENGIDDRIRILFPNSEDASLFIYMKGRAYVRDVWVGFPLEPIQIRVTPNFGQWASCKIGFWVGSLYHSDGAFAGGHCPSLNLEEARRFALERAFLYEPKSPIELDLMLEETWEEIDAKQPVKIPVLDL